MSLSIIIWLPAVAGALSLLAPRAVAGRLAVVGALATLVLAVILLVGFDNSAPGLQNVTDQNWISALGIHYKLGIDGLNVWLLTTTAMLFFAAILFASFREWERPNLFFFFFAVAESAVLGAFCAQDLILFVVFFDLMLIPFYFITGMWGGEGRVQATTKMVIYTLIGSLLMLVAAVATGVIAAEGGQPLTFAISGLQQAGLSTGTQEWIFLGFAAAFLVKMPLFPLHGWMPDAYRTMPLPALAVFSGILSKVAAYGFLRIVIPLFPDGAAHFQELLLLIALASIIYGSVMAFTQTNLRLIFGFSSVAQLGFIVLGIFALSPRGAEGALLQMVNHAVITVPVFLIIALLAARSRGSEDIREMGGLAFRAPLLAVLFLIVSLATLAMPGSSNFIGEFYILLGVFESKTVIAIIAFSGVAMAAVYALRAYISTMHNRVGAQATPREIGLQDALVLVPLVLVILALAIYPQAPLKAAQGPAARSVAKARLALDPLDQRASTQKISQVTP